MFKFNWLKKRRPKFEYFTFITTDDRFNQQTINENLKELGRQGFELVHTATHDKDTTLYFKRKAQ